MATVRIFRPQTITQVKQLLEQLHSLDTLPAEHEILLYLVDKIKSGFSMLELAAALYPLHVRKQDGKPDYDGVRLARKVLRQFCKLNPWGLQIVGLSEPWQTLDGKVSRAYLLRIALGKRAQQAIEMVDKLITVWQTGLAAKKDSLIENVKHAKKRQAEVEANTRKLDVAIARSKRRRSV